MKDVQFIARMIDKMLKQAYADGVKAGRAAQVPDLAKLTKKQIASEIAALRRELEHRAGRR